MARAWLLALAAALFAAPAAHATLRWVPVSAPNATSNVSAFFSDCGHACAAYQLRAVNAGDGENAVCRQASFEIGTPYPHRRRRTAAAAYAAAWRTLAHAHALQRALRSGWRRAGNTNASAAQPTCCSPHAGAHPRAAAECLCSSPYSALFNNSLDANSTAWAIGCRGTICRSGPGGTAGRARNGTCVWRDRFCKQANSSTEVYYLCGS